MITNYFGEKIEYRGLSSSLVGFESFQVWRFKVIGS